MFEKKKRKEGSNNGRTLIYKIFKKISGLTVYRFTLYMPNKPDKFALKFWLASDVSSKYIVNSFQCLGKMKGIVNPI